MMQILYYRNVMENIDEYSEELFRLVGQLLRKSRHMEMDPVMDLGLTGPQAFAIVELLGSEPVTMGALAEKLGIGHGVATRLVDRLVEKGLVERTRDENDRRVVLVSLSESGSHSASRVTEVARETIKSVFEGVTVRERQEFLQMLKRLTDGL